MEVLHQRARVEVSVAGAAVVAAPDLKCDRAREAARDRERSHLEMKLRGSEHEIAVGAVEASARTLKTHGLVFGEPAGQLDLDLTNAVEVELDPPAIGLGKARRR